jgi:glycosyltransferase involved in cell wall biosynthesis
VSRSIGYVPLSIVVLTRDEELNLPACLSSVSDWASQVVIVDSGSSDRTTDIARAAGAEVVEHPFTTHTHQWQWALDNLSLANAWVLGLDADQRVSATLRDELAELFSRSSALDGIEGLWIPRHQVFRGRLIRHGGYFPVYLLKAFRRSAVHLDPSERVDHHFYVGGATWRMRGHIIEANVKEDDLSFWVDKHRRYARLLAEELAAGRASATSSWERARELERGRRDRFYRWPPYWRAVAYFLYRYIARLGFLDGRQGFLFHFLQALWYRVLVDAELETLKRRERGPAS